MVYKISVIGSGNWGSVVANIVSKNVKHLTEFSNDVRMWVYPEKIGGESLVDIINTRHENVKYLPNFRLSENLMADSDLRRCTENSDFLVFVLPHQFLDRICGEMKPFIKKNAIAISFIKGLFCGANGIELVSQRISTHLKIPTCVVSGANVAGEVAENKFAEATLGFGSETDHKTVKLLQKVFSLPSLRITPVNDVAAIEISGALKNVIALAAGFVDGLKYGSNTKAAILRIGMIEIQNFGMEFFSGIRANTFWQSSGFADLITTCYAGRNRKCAEEFVRSGDDFEKIEKRLLSGQKLQGPLTCKEVYEFLKTRNKLDHFPLLVQIYLIVYGENGKKEDPRTIVDIFLSKEMPEIVFKPDK